MTRQRFTLINDMVRQNAIAAILKAEPGSVVSVGPQTRTLSQNARLWAMLADVSKAKPDGRKWVPETWKAAFMHALGYQVQFCEGLDGCGPFPIGFRSSTLSVKQMADLITCIQEYGDRHGVAWTETISGGWHDAANDWRAA